ncbi:MAG: ferredoxin [Armatimonadetes bacterium]|nr:ferredoxin [Armatimonadota bacterium]
MNVLYLNLTRCIYCRACEVACEREHDGISRVAVTLVDPRQPVPVSCRHCEKHPCLEACPETAIEAAPGGAIIIHTRKCISCGLCVIACPFGAIELDAGGKIAEKCDLCEHRQRDGRLPACLLTCPARCIEYGPLDDILAVARTKPGATFVAAMGETGTVVTLPDRSVPGV